MIKHKDSHLDHGFTQAQWDYIFAKFADKTAFFIDTFELPEDLGTVTNELYGPSAGDAPVHDSEIVWGKRGDRTWDSRLVMKPKRPTRFVRVIAGPHEEKCVTCDGTNKHVTLGFMVQFGMSQEEATGPCPKCVDGIRKYECILYTSYGVPSIDAPQSPKEPDDLVRALQKLLEEEDVLKRASMSELERDSRMRELRPKVLKAQEAYLEASAFWKQHALAAPLSMHPCNDCGAPRMGDAVYDPPVPDTDGRCQTCGTL